MIRRILFATAGVAVLGAVLLGTEALSYLRTSAGCLSEAVHNRVPVEFQIERARRMIHDLKPEIRKNMHLIAKEEVELERLQKQISQLESRADKERGQLLRLKTDLTTAGNTFRYAGRSYSRQQVKVDLANRFERYKTGEGTLDNLRRIHDARRRGLEAARQKLEGMLAARRQLQVEVENLDAQSQMVAAAKTTSDYQFDESRLGRVKQLIADLQVRLDTEKRVIHAEDYFHDEIPLERAVPEDIVEQITQYFGDDRPEVQVAAKD